MLLEDGTSEHGIANDYSMRLCGTLSDRKMLYAQTNTGNVSRRLKHALSRKVDAIVSLHMSQNASSCPEAESCTLLPVVRSWRRHSVASLSSMWSRCPRIRLATINASVEIESGNILCVSQMADLRSVEYCIARCSVIANAVATL